MQFLAARTRTLEGVGPFLTTLSIPLFLYKEGYGKCSQKGTQALQGAGPGREKLHPKSQKFNLGSKGGIFAAQNPVDSKIALEGRPWKIEKKSQSLRNQPPVYFELLVWQGLEPGLQSLLRYLFDTHIPLLELLVVIIREL